MRRKFLCASLLSLTWGVAVLAHVGSPDVFLEGKAGPYQLFVTVRPPMVIPGVAELEVRSESPGVTEIRAAPMPIAGAGAKFAPVPDKLERSREDRQFFTGTLWMMAPGSWQVRITANGDKGRGTVAVPVPSVALATKKMRPMLGGLLSIMGLFIVAGVVAMAGAAVREGKVEPGRPIPAENNRKAKAAMVVAFFIVAGAIWIGNKWWNAEAASYGQQVYKPLIMKPALDAQGVLTLTLSDPGWFSPKNAVDYRRMLFTRTTDDLVPDHNHLMHLYLIRQPGLDFVYHLHPVQTRTGVFSLALPKMASGEYRLYADIVHASGFPETLVSRLEVPEGLPGRSLAGDDASGSSTAWDTSPAGVTDFNLPDGYVMHWIQNTQEIHARVPYLFRFTLADSAGRPARDVQLYMGMLGHAAFVKTDGTVFAHIHPSGSVSMAAMDLAQAQSGTAGSEMKGMDMPAMNMETMSAPSREGLPNEVSFPYGFPTTGRYRIFVQMKHGDSVETGVFDANVT